MGKFAFFEICSGTGAMAKAAHTVQFKLSYTMDILNSMDPDYVCDITDPSSLQEVEEQITHLKSQGYYIAFHFSPPCNAYSRMQKCHPISDSRLAKKIVRANILVNAGLAFAILHGDAWTLENPQTGNLWKQPAGTFVADISNTVDLDYCCYGGAMMKCTTIAFSSAELMQAFGASRRCDRLTCDSMFVNDLSGLLVHQSIQDTADYHDRIKIPEQLAIKLTSTMKNYLKTLPLKLQSGPDCEPLPISRMREPKKVIAYRILKRGLGEFKFTGGENYMELCTDEALKHPWADILLLRAFCKRENTYVFRRILERDGDRVLVEWRDYPDPTWEDASEYVGKKGCGAEGALTAVSDEDD